MRFLAWIVLLALAIASFDSRARPIEPIKLSLCQLLSDPARYDHAIVEVSGYVVHGFEEFDMVLSDCPTQQGMGMGLWLEYGGVRHTQTKYCCAEGFGPDRKKPLIVEGVRCNLVADAVFDRFDHLLEPPGYRAVTATIVGRFFAGQRIQLGHGSYWGGYGHMGAYSLLVIERVLSVEPAAYKPMDEVPARNASGALPPIDVKAGRP